MKSLENKIAIVTGAGSGIGRSIAMLFAKKGAKIVVSDINVEGGNETVAHIKQMDGDAVFIKANTADPKACEELVAQTVKHFGGLHIAVNNAGIGGPIKPLGEYPIEGWDKVISINLSGVFYGMRYQIPAMLKSGSGSIVNIASILGVVGTRYSPAYVAAKHGVVGLTKAGALEYANQGIRINAVCPGYIKTPLLEAVDADTLKQLEGMHPIGRLGTSDEVAELVAWLSSDHASFVTGSHYTVDGGYTAQ